MRIFIVHAFISSRESRMHNCNSLSICLFPLQFLLNAAARLIARLLRSSHMSSYIFYHSYLCYPSLPFLARSQFKLIALVYRSFYGLAPKYLSLGSHSPADLMSQLISASALASPTWTPCPAGKSCHGQFSRFCFTTPLCWTNFLTWLIHHPPHPTAPSLIKLIAWFCRGLSHRKAFWVV